tara:strand:- start:2288 stop:2947 length:660 start_codon:yes stop_codon:yes gene_type:complete
MIPKIIHQIYFNLSNTVLADHKIFYQSHNICKKYTDYHYMLWSEKECEDLLNCEFPQYKDFYNNFRYEIQKIDFIRFCILYRYGGFYVDLDMFMLKSFNELLARKVVFHNVRHVKPNWSFIENDFMGSVPKFQLWLDIMEKCVENYKDKEVIDIYKIWKGRFILQTTGPKFLSRFIQKKFPKFTPMKLVYTKFQSDPKDGYYLQDYKLNTWIKNQQGIL